MIHLRCRFYLFNRISHYFQYQCGYLRSSNTMTLYQKDLKVEYKREHAIICFRYLIKIKIIWLT